MKLSLVVQVEIGIGDPDFHGEEVRLTGSAIGAVRQILQDHLLGVGNLNDLEPLRLLDVHEMMYEDCRWVFECPSPDDMEANGLKEVDH
jgi:hypothetical protein